MAPSDAEASRLDVLHADDALLAVDKPPGLLSQADRTGDPDVLSLLRTRYDSTAIRLVHRLDRPASGVMVLGRTQEAARILSRQFRERLADKRYLAVVEGTCTGLGRCVDYLVKAGQQVRVVAPEHPDGKRAELTWQAVATSAGRSLLNVQLLTGRPHQARIQLAERGHPIVGDMRYGATSELDGQNLALHSYALSVDHPSSPRRCTFSSGPPAAWASVLDDPLRAAVDRLLARV
jgi:tRNA pseudouridine32 synthase/23S rRNA pseudouridine746 synthase/23S rRNA pseudouridine1911/1915/1917 synthase